MLSEEHWRLRMEAEDEKDPRARLGLKKERRKALRQLNKSLENNENSLWDGKARELE